MTDLGDLVRQHQGSPWKWLSAAALSFLFVAGGIYAIAEMHPPSPGKVGLFVAGFAAIMLGFLYVAMVAAAARLELRERGLVYRRGGKVSSVRYAEVARAIERTFNGKSNQLILELRNGGRIEIQATLVDYHAAVEAIARAI